MTVKELMDYLKNCPEDAVIRIEDSNTSYEYPIDKPNGMAYYNAEYSVIIFVQ